jgi:hypothetical protein
MAIIISLADIVEALEMSSQTSTNYFDPATGDILLVTDEDELALEDPDTEGMPEWEVEHLEKVRKLLDSGRAVPLPNSFEIHAWSLMEEYCYSVTNENQQKILLDSIHGKGAFQRFRTTLEQFALEEEWYSFRENALKQIARDWLEANKIVYKE